MMTRSSSAFSSFMYHIKSSPRCAFSFNLPLRRFQCHMSSPAQSPSVSPTVTATRAKHEGEKPVVLVLTGPTSVGKSSTALSYCLRHPPAEIISADSVQLYRHLSIGCNKPSDEELAQVQHHLLNIADPSDANSYTAGDFYRAARSTTRNLIDQNVLPVVVGGTMMYVRWFIHGRPATPPTSNDARERTKCMIEGCEGDWDKAIGLLKERDGKRAAELNRNDWYRLTRAIEVWETTGGKGVTDLPVVGAAPGAVEKRYAAQNGDIDGKPTTTVERVAKTHVDGRDTGVVEETGEFDFRCLFLYMPDRVAMNRKIDLRCEYMLLPKDCHRSKVQHGVAGCADGPENGESWREVRSVLVEITNLLVSSQLAVVPTSPCMAIGYRQTIRYLLSLCLWICGHAPTTTLGSIESQDEEEMRKKQVRMFRQYVEDFQQATRAYAKQQMAWFRKDPFFQWVPVGDAAVDTISHLTQLASSDYAKWCNDNKEEQTRIKVDMMEQGKKAMRTYIARREWLVEGSDAEQAAVELAWNCAKLMTTRFENAELLRMVKVVTR